MNFLKNNFFIFCIFLFSNSVTFAGQIVIDIDNKINQILVDTAVSLSQKKKGLMFVKKLKESNGMMFLYNKPKIVNMWMKNTYIDLDIIFINEKKIVSKIVKGIKNSTNIISSGKPVIAVLEIPSECNQKLQIHENMFLSWKEITKKEFEKKNSKTKKDLLPCI